MRIHILGVPHTQSSEKFSTCAFTQKVVNLCKMLHRRGHHVVHYGVEGSSVECAEHISVVSEAEWSALYPPVGRNFYNLETWGIYAPYHTKWASECNKALRTRTGADNTEIICLTWGGTQRTACEGVPQFLVESGIGYKHSWSDWRVYESYAWLHMHLGEAGLYQGDKWYWAVIPNAFDVTKFDFNTTRGENFLYIGRLNDDKGVGLAVHVAREAGRRITIVGQGDPTPYLANNPHVTYHEPVDAEGRRKLFSQTYAVLCPTRYVEPFCGVNVEAQMAGIPVITTDWGAFSETVLHGRTGFRCRTFEQFVWAARSGVDRISPKDCRQWAVDNYSLERIALMYEEYFQQVLNVGVAAGFYLPNPNRTQLDWMQKRFSQYEPEDERVDLTRPHEAPPMPVVEVAPALVGSNGNAGAAAAATTPTTDAEWDEAQRFERQWWGLEWRSNWDDELMKQQHYFRLMGMPEPLGEIPDQDGAGLRDFGSKSILDVGCGPISLLQRSIRGFARGVDPLAVSDETLRRYKDASVEFLNIKAEDMPVDQIFDEVWMYNCFSGDTRFWADGQLVRFADAVGEDVEVLAGDGEWRKASVKSFGKQRLQRVIFYPYHAPTSVMYEYDVTPNHRWITTTRGEVTDLRVGDRVLATPIVHENDAVFRDGFVHGFTFGDGHRLLRRHGIVRVGRFAIRLCGEKSKHLSTIKESTFYRGETYPPSYGGDPVVWLQAPTDLKRVPETETSLRYQAGFIAGWMAADGNSKKKEGSPSLVLWSINIDALNWAAERAPLLGWCVTGRTKVSNMETTFGPRSAPVHSLTLRPEPTEYRVRAIVDEGREEEVYCVVEPETHTFTLEGGLVTGNCLQHVQDPEVILTKIAIMGRTVRIFEWIDLGVCDGHPQNLTEEMFWAHFGTDEWDRKIWNVGSLRDFGGTVTNKYIAIWAVCKRAKVDILSELQTRLAAERRTLGIDVSSTATHT